MERILTYHQLRHMVEQSPCFWIFGTTSKALFSRIIRFFTQSKISHVGILLFFYDRLWVVEMIEGVGCRILPASSRFNKGDYVVVGKLPNARIEPKIIESILADVGKVKYNLKGCILAPFVSTNGAEKFCSEFVTDKLNINFNTLERGIYPSDVMEKCEYTYFLI